MIDPRHISRDPPRVKNYAGNPRHVGIEIEFAALSARTVASEVHQAFGGEIVQRDRHRFEINGTGLGDFKTELDTRYAHRPDETLKGGTAANATSFEPIVDALRDIYGDISSFIVPCEIITPPLRIDQFRILDAFIRQLTKVGARGTGSNPFYAFGTHFNPDIATTNSDWILAVIKSAALLSDWMRAVMSIDLSRRLASFADPLPRAYVHKILAPDYWPDEATMIDDYLTFNPSRDRELDMLPLFAWLDEKSVQRAVPGMKVNKRPTFHWRLPNADLGVPGWSIALEWNRWCVIERLADDRDRLNAMGRNYLENDLRLIPENWAIRSTEWLLT